MSVAGVWWGKNSGAMAVGREVLVELVDVKSVDGADDVGAELWDVHVTEVNVLTGGGRNRAGDAVQGPMAVVFVPHVKVGFRCSWRCWRSMRLTWKPKPRKHQSILMCWNKIVKIEDLVGIGNVTYPVWKVMMVHLPHASQPGHAWFCFIQTMLMLLLDQARSTVPLPWFGALASPRLVLVVWVVFLVLHPQPLGLLDEGTLLQFREKSEDEMNGLSDYWRCFWIATTTLAVQSVNSKKDTHAAICIMFRVEKPKVLAFSTVPDRKWQIRSILNTLHHFSILFNPASFF